MPTLFHHEVQSYRAELKRLKSDIQKIAKPGAVENLTHASFGVSNRGNQMVVGLCSLVEVRLFELAEGGKSPIKLSDMKGQGISRLKLFLSRLGIVDFGRLKKWDDFTSVYELRNSIVHSYGGMVVDEPSPKLVKHLSKLGLTNILIGGRRIRLDPDALEIILNIVDSLLAGLTAYDEKRNWTSA
jgi:hypothetical protein